MNAKHAGEWSWVSPINNAYPAAAAFRRCRVSASTHCSRSSSPVGRSRRPGICSEPTSSPISRGPWRLPFASANIAEEQGHHPDLHVGWGRCGVEIWTHKIDGLTESDFFLAAKADRAFRT